MNGVDVLVGLAGTLVTLLTLAGMVLLTPRGTVDVHTEGAEAPESNLSPVAQAPEGVPVNGTR